MGNWYRSPRVSGVSVRKNTVTVRCRANGMEISFGEKEKSSSARRDMELDNPELELCEPTLWNLSTSTDVEKITRFRPPSSSSSYPPPVSFKFYFTTQTSKTPRRFHILTKMELYLLFGTQITMFVSDPSCNTLTIRVA